VRLSYRTHEEKETDVAIALLYPTADIAVAFPFKRHNRDLERLVTRHVKISAQLYERHQFPASFTTACGKLLTKPATW
jgi:hypothetical protein